MTIKIQSAKVFVCSPDRNFVTLHVETDARVYGLGDATLSGRELAVVAYLAEHVLPCLVGRDASEIEEIWQYLYIGMTVVHGGGISHARKVADFAAIYGVRTGYHGATDLSPIAMVAALHLGLAVHNFEIQEHMPHTASDPAWLLRGHAPNLARPRKLHPEPRPPSDLRIDSNVPASQHPVDPSLPDHPLAGTSVGATILARNAQFRQLPVHDIARRSCLITGSNLSAGPSFLIILRIESARFGIVPKLRTSPSVSATATAIVSAWTSRPKNHNFSFMTGSLPLVALNCGSF